MLQSRVLRLLVAAFLLAAVASLPLGSAVFADEPAKPAARPPGGGAGGVDAAAANGAKNMADVSNKAADDVAARYAKATGKTKDAADALVAAFKAQAAVQLRAADAAASGDREKAGPLRAELVNASVRISLCRDALDAREAEAGLADQSELENWRKRAGTGAAAEMEAFVATRKKAELAAGKLADLASKPNADYTAVEEAKDELMAARNDALLSQRILTNTAEAISRDAVAAKANVPDFTKKAEEIKALDKQYIAEMRKAFDAQLAMRKLDRMRREAAMAGELARQAANAPTTPRK
ncbi:MAG: hypothetical protein NTW19_14005 [Planctomycetota bacterium]|nr:hypothetical protein [Planctomycetota bacterium]